MANQFLLERLVGIQTMLMGVHAAGTPMSASSKGREREQFIDQFLANALPPIYRFGSGDATDADGRRSGQLDVVIEYPFSPNIPVGANQPTRLYLAEAIAAVIEVKSNLAGQWDEAVRTANALAPLERDFGMMMAMGSMPPKAIPTYAVGYTGWKTMETLRAKLDEAPSIKGILIIDGGLFCTRHGEGAGAAGLWGFIGELFNEIAVLRSAAVNPLAYLRPFPPLGGMNPTTVNTTGARSNCDDYRTATGSPITSGGTFGIGNV